MTNVALKTNELETVLERTVLKMDTECAYLLEFWKNNDVSFMGRSDGRQAFFSKYLGYFEALTDSGLFDADDLKNGQHYLRVFMSQLNEAVREMY